MEFTIVFRCKDKEQVTYGLSFQPHPVWKNGEDWYLELNPEHSVYQMGSVKRLLIREEYLNEMLHDSKECLLIYDEKNEGNKYLKDINDDLENEGFKVSLVKLG